MTATPEKIAKLPKWAQDHIKVLTQHLVESEREFARMFGDGAKPDTGACYKTYAHSRSHLPEYLPLPHGEARFKLGKDRWNREHEVQVMMGRTVEGVASIEVRTSVGSMRIIPHVSNVVSITTLDPRDTESKDD